MLSLPLYHSFTTFQFNNIFPFEECAFVLKPQVLFNELEPNSCPIFVFTITINIGHYYLQFGFVIQLRNH